jgi:phospholipase C
VGFLALPSLSLLQISGYSQDPKSPTFPGRFSLAIGANFTAKVLDALTSYPKVWAKCALLLTYDENDGLFDHVAPPAPPSYNLDGTLTGKAT